MSYCTVWCRIFRSRKMSWLDGLIQFSCRAGPFLSEIINMTVSCSVFKQKETASSHSEKTLELSVCISLLGNISAVIMFIWCLLVELGWFSPTKMVRVGRSLMFFFMNKWNSWRTIYFHMGRPNYITEKSVTASLMGREKKEVILLMGQTAR